MHPFDVIARILSAPLRGSAAAADLGALLGSRAIDWERVVGHASAEFVLPACAAALKELDLIGALDQELAAFLEAVHAANLERNRELCAELAVAVDALNRAGIEPVLLKGAIRLVDGVYPDHGWRALQDLDLLVPEATLTDANRALAEAGYASCGSDGEVRRPDGACQIDLHAELFPTARQVRLLEAQEVLDAARPVAFANGLVKIPAIEHQLVHLIGHCQVRHLGHALGRIAPRHRLEAAALVHWGREPIDWQSLQARFSRAGYRRPLLCFLQALHDGAWCTLPPTGKLDRLVALQGRRIALQARSRPLGCLGAQIGWWVSAFTSQIDERDGSERKATRNLKSLMSERGGVRRIARAFLVRREHLLHLWPYLGWFIAQ